MAYSSSDDPRLEIPYRNAVLKVGQELFVMVVKDSINYESLKDFISGKSMTVLKKKFSVDQIKYINNGELDFQNLDIADLFILAKYDCGINPVELETPGTLSYLLVQLKAERNTISHKDIKLTREMVENKIEDLKVLYCNILIKLGEQRGSKGGSAVVYKQYADTIVKRLDELKPELNIQDLAIKIDQLSLKIDRNTSFDTQSNVASSVDQCDSPHQQIYYTNRPTSSPNRVEDKSIKKMLFEISKSADSSNNFCAALKKWRINILSYDQINLEDILKCILPSMDKYQRNVYIQWHGLSIIKHNICELNCALTNQRSMSRLVEAAVTSLENHYNYPNILWVSIKILFKCKGPQMLSRYKRLTIIIVQVLSVYSSEEYDSYRLDALYLLKHMSFGVDAGYKEMIASSGIMKVLLQLTQKKHMQMMCDDELLMAWDCLCSLTDRTPINCKEFIEENGLIYANWWLQEFGGESDLVQSVLLLLGNICELSPELQKALFTTSIIEKGYELLRSNIADYKVSCLAARLLCLMTSGQVIWTIRHPTKDQVLERIGAVLERWDPETDFLLCTLTFKRELQLLQNFSIPEIHHYVLWLLAWFTKKDADMYCALLEEEGGLPIIQKVMDSTKHYHRIKELARIVIKQCDDFKMKPK